MPVINTFDYGKAVEQGQRNALVDMRLQQEPQRHQNYLRSSEMDHQLKGLEYMRKTAPRARDQKSWDMVSQDWVQKGLAQPGDLPQQYDPELVQFLSGVTPEKLQEFSDMQPIPNMPGYRGQQDKRTKKWANIYDTSKSSSGVGGGGGLKAADENAMHRQAASLFGGMYDPQTGRFSALSKDDAQRAQAIAEYATRLYVDSGGTMTRTEAVTTATRKLGIEVTNLSQPKIEIRVHPKTGKRYEVDVINNKVLRELP